MVAALTGRRDQLALLRGAVAEVAGSVPGAVLLTGLPGVGKTRLGREALALAADAGFATFTGRAHELGRGLAYAPLVAAFGPTLRDAPAARRSALVGDLPQLGLPFAGLGLPDPTPLGDADLERSRLVDGLGQLLERLAREGPLALLLDDVHSADDSTLAFLHYLSEVVTDLPILLVITARRGETGVDRVAALARDLADSSWSDVLVPVDPLPPEEATALVSNLLGGPAEPRLASLVVDRCAGRPLFVEAVVRTLIESRQVTEVDGIWSLRGPDMPLPDAVRDQLRSRIAPVSADERTLLNVLAVADEPLEHSLLARAGQLTQERTVDALDRLHARGLLSAGAPTSHDELVHALLRDTLLVELSPASTARFHAQLARALIADGGRDPRTAAHVLQAGSLLPLEQALPQLTRGADRAISLAGGEDAVHYLQPAIAAADVLGRTDLLVELHGKHATVCQRLGRNEEAAVSWTAALAASTELADPVATARIEQELGMLDWTRGELDAARGHFDAAECALDGLEPSLAHAALLHTKAVVASRVGDSDTVARSARALRVLAEQLDSPVLSAQAALAEAVLGYAATDYVAMFDGSARALDAARRGGDPLLANRAYDQMSVAAASQLDLPAVRRYSAESLRIAEQLGAPVLGGFARLRLAAADLLGGDWDAALRTTTELTVLIRRYGQRRGSVSALGAHAWVLAHRGRLVDAQAYVDEARAIAKPMLQTDRNVFSIVALAETTLALMRGDASRAAVCARQLEHATGGWMPLLGLALLGEAQARSGDVAGAGIVVERLNAVVSCSTIAPYAFAKWVGGLIEVQDGRAQSAVVSFAAAADAFEKLGLPFATAQAQLAAAAAQVATSPDAAAPLAAAALVAFDTVGAPIQAQQARELLRGLGVVPSRGRARQPTGSPLSARELEVARLVAAGLSNAQVATDLFISPRTVTTHLNRIYARLGFSSRVALTRYLADSGLLEADAVSS